ncbi:MAG TPA: hypothetical protein VF332_00245 [Vicinamibacterales bacterium]
MPQMGAPRLRVRATLVAVLYACILSGGALIQHTVLCANTPGSHCTLCACADSVPLVVEADAPSPEFDDAGEIAPIVGRAVPVVAGHDTVSRAPPSVGAAVS